MLVISHFRISYRNVNADKAVDVIMRWDTSAAYACKKRCVVSVLINFSTQRLLSLVGMLLWNIKLSKRVLQTKTRRKLQDVNKSATALPLSILKYQKYYRKNLETLENFDTYRTYVPNPHPQFPYGVNFCVAQGWICCNTICGGTCVKYFLLECSPKTKIKMPNTL